jgi:cytoskeletal protein RodZ
MSFTRPPEINGSALKAARKKGGIDIAELATQCCLSSKMIVELEEGGMKSFYNHQLKVSAAKRVGSYLGLATEDYLEYRIDVAQNANIGDDENGQLVEETVLAKEDAPKSLVDEGEQRQLSC